jgi:NMD protein affecting ribosome stability and mRNA decay
MEEKITDICFVCKTKLTDGNFKINKEVYLPVCKNCDGTARERKAVEEQLDSLADGLVCGCI